MQHGWANDDEIFPLLVNKKGKVCDVLHRGRMDVVWTKKTNIVLMFFYTCMYTDAHICNGVFFSFIFFFLVSVAILRHAASQILKHTWLRRCVCGWMERVLQCFHLRVTQNPSPVLYHLHLCVCLYSCTGATTHASLI